MKAPGMWDITHPLPWGPGVSEIPGEQVPPLAGQVREPFT